MKTRDVAFGAVSGALALALLYGASVAPSAKLALMAASALPTAMVVVASGKRVAACQYVATAALAVLALPEKGVALMYAMFFGHYSILKSLIEGLDRLWLEWCLKLLVFFACAGGMYAIWHFGFNVEFGLSMPLLAAAGAAAFVIYDIAYTGLIFFMVKRLRIKS